VSRRAVIVGRGAVTPAGAGVAPLWDAVRNGISCVRAEEFLDLEGLPIAKVSARFPDATLAEINARHGSPGRPEAEALLREAVAQALAESGISARDGANTVLLTTQLPESGFERTSPETGYGAALREPARRADGAAARQGLGASWLADLRARLGSGLTTFSMQATCATGLRLVCEAARLIQLGRAERAIVAVLSRPVDAVHVAAFARALALSRWDGAPSAASRPFDQKRSGFVFGEAAGALVIEAEELARARGAAGFGRILGWGLAMNSQHFLRTSLRHMLTVVRAALRQSRLEAPTPWARRLPSETPTRRAPSTAFSASAWARSASARARP
jgi:3-oxoacyl-[acyl-carrier-protein] synthase II